MPLYDYSCPECKTIKEYNLPMDHNKPVCNHCNCIQSRVFTRAPSFKFVGAGFYSNDYKETNYDRMTGAERDSHDQRAVEGLDEKYEREEKEFKQKVRDDLR